MIELSDGNLQVDGLTYIRNWGDPTVQAANEPGYHLELYVDQVALVTEHVCFALRSAGGQTTRPASSSRYQKRARARQQIPRLAKSAKLKNFARALLRLRR